MSQNKELRFQFVVDERSAQQMKRVLTELIGLGQQLAKTLNGVSIGGGGGGGLISGNVGAAQSPTQMIAGGAAPKGATSQNRGLAQVFIDSGKNIKGLADVSKDSMRVMSDAIKRAVDEQKRSITSLDDQLVRLAKRYDDLKTREKSAVSGGHMTADRAREHYDAKRAEVMGEHAETEMSRQKAKKDLENLAERQRQMTIASDPYAALGGEDGDEPPRKPGLGERMMGMVPPQARGMISRYGGVAGLALGARAIYGTAWDSIWNDPMAFQRMSAQRGALWQDPLLSTHMGDRSYLDATGRVFGDRNKAQDFKDISNQTWSARWNNFQAGHLLNWGEGLRAQSDVALAQTVQQRQREFIDAEIQADPMRAHMMGQLGGQSGMRLSMMRSLGIGNGFDKKTGQYKTHFDDFLQSFRDRGYSEGEAVGAVGAIESASTRLAGRRFAHTALSAQGAGIHSAAGIIGAMSEGGLSNASGFMDALLTQRGDVGGLNQIGAAVAQMVQHGGHGDDGLGLLRILSQGLTGGAGDSLIARQNIAGLQLSERNLMQGGLDPYQQARNTQLAFRKFGDKGLYAAQYAATQMTAEDIASLSSKKGLSPSLTSLGFTQDDVAGLMELQGGKSSSRLDRLVSDPRAAGSPMAKTLDSLRAHIAKGGSPQSWIGEQENRDKALSDIATSMVVSGQATDYSSALGMARTEFGLFSDGSGKVGRRGAAGGGSLEADQMKLQAQAAKDFTTWMQTEAKGLIATGSQMQAARDIMVKNVEDIAKSGGDVAQALAAVADTIKATASGAVSRENAPEYMKAIAELNAARAAVPKTSGGGGVNSLNAQKRVQAAQKRVNELKGR